MALKTPQERAPSPVALKEASATATTSSCWAYAGSGASGSSVDGESGNWAGVSASPTAAGKYIYLMDNQGLTIVLQPGRVYKEVSQNMLEDLKGDGKAQEQNVSTPIFDGGRMYYRTPGYLYCIGQ